MPSTLLTSASAIVKAGTNANSTIILSASTLQDWADEAEAYFCDVARYDLVTNYSNINTQGRLILRRGTSAMVAQNIVTFDMGSYGSMREAETILDKLEDEKTTSLNLIKEDRIKTYLNIT